MIACALLPRLSLVAAAGERRELLGRPVALAPEPNVPRQIGATSGAAEAFGVRAGMSLSEALARCPALLLLSPCPSRAEAIWEKALRELEGIGAAAEADRPGEAFFGLRELRELHGPPEATLAVARRALGPPARLGAGPTRLCAYAAALRARARRRPPIVREAVARPFLDRLPIGILRERLGGDGGIEPLERLGIRTVGELAALPAHAVADRFGEAGLRALRISQGLEKPLRPRCQPPELLERLRLPEAASGAHLERALRLLIARLLANPSRRGRTFRRLRLEAPLAGGGSWRADAMLRSASADPDRLRLALASKLALLPEPALAFGLRALEMGPRAGRQQQLGRSSADERRRRLGEAVRQARAVGGRDALLRIVEVDPRSRVPERRVLLAPAPDPGGEP